jgi:hypothetical protein
MNIIFPGVLYGGTSCLLSGAVVTLFFNQPNRQIHNVKGSNKEAKETSPLLANQRGQQSQNNNSEETSPPQITTAKPSRILVWFDVKDDKNKDGSYRRLFLIIGLACFTFIVSSR